MNTRRGSQRTNTRTDYSPIKRMLRSDPKRVKEEEETNESTNNESTNDENNERLIEFNYNNIDGYKNEMQNLSHLINNTIESGESNSILICGGRGFGKTVLLEKCLSQIKFEGELKTIRLNGFIHSNDLSCIRFIAKQLNIEANVNDIKQMMTEFKKLCKDSKFRIIIVLDEFDVFCRRHQTLLYNLFDVIQNSPSICIIGMTTRLDCIEMLEKRVRSRINQRVVHLVSPFSHFEDYVNFALKLMKANKMNDSLREKLRIQFSLNKSVAALKQVLIENEINKKILSSSSSSSSSSTTTSFNSHDKKLQSLLCLSKYEFCVLLFAHKYSQNHNTLTFNCFSVMESMRQVPLKISKIMFLKIIYNLSQVGLIVQHASVRKHDALISEWSVYSLNVDEIHLEEAKKHIKLNQDILKLL